MPVLGCAFLSLSPEHSSGGSWSHGAQDGALPQRLCVAVTCTEGSGRADRDVAAADGVLRRAREKRLLRGCLLHQHRGPVAPCAPHAPGIGDVASAGSGRGAVQGVAAEPG